MAVGCPLFPEPRPGSWVVRISNTPLRGITQVWPRNWIGFGITQVCLTMECFGRKLRTSIRSIATSRFRVTWGARDDGLRPCYLSVSKRFSGHRDGTQGVSLRTQGLRTKPPKEPMFDNHNSDVNYAIHLQHKSKIADVLRSNHLNIPALHTFFLQVNPLAGMSCHAKCSALGNPATIAIPPKSWSNYEASRCILQIHCHDMTL